MGATKKSKLEEIIAQYDALTLDDEAYGSKMVLSEYPLRQKWILASKILREKGVEIFVTNKIPFSSLKLEVVSKIKSAFLEIEKIDPKIAKKMFDYEEN